MFSVSDGVKIPGRGDINTPSLAVVYVSFEFFMVLSALPCIPSTRAPSPELSEGIF